MIHTIIHFLTAFVLVISYYYYFRYLLRVPTYSLARFFKLTKKMSVEEAKAVVGFVLVTISHIVFALLIALYFKINLFIMAITIPCIKINLLSLLVGMGLSGTSAILSLFIIKVLACINPQQFSHEQFYRSLSSGWYSAYQHVYKILPLVLTIILIMLQLACEEVVFRGIFLTYFLKDGIIIAILFSTLLFTLMQIFHMPSWKSALFPVVGAMLMGPVHGLLFFVSNSFLPVVLSHTIYFLTFLI